MVASNRCQAKGHVGEKQEYSFQQTLIGLFITSFFLQHALFVTAVCVLLIGRGRIKAQSRAMGNTADK